jgi:hypothetical protein
MNIGNGITFAIKNTIQSPKGERITAAGMKVVPQGIALMVEVEEGKKKKQFAVTLDALTVMEMVGQGMKFLTNSGLFK